jgi:hypothetical protein
MVEPLDFAVLAVDLDDVDPNRLLLGWEERLGGEWLPMLVTALGDAFVQSLADGRVAFLDYASATLEPVCGSADELEELLENPEFLEHYFDPEAVQRLLAAGVAREADQVYALAAPKSAGGDWTLDNVLLRTCGLSSRRFR